MGANKFAKGLMPEGDLRLDGDLRLEGDLIGDDRRLDRGRVGDLTTLGDDNRVDGLVEGDLIGEDNNVEDGELGI